MHKVFLSVFLSTVTKHILYTIVILHEISKLYGLFGLLVIYIFLEHMRWNQESAKTAHETQQQGHGMLKKFPAYKHEPQQLPPNKNIKSHSDKTIIILTQLISL